MSDSSSRERATSPRRIFSRDAPTAHHQARTRVSLQYHRRVSCDETPQLRAFPRSRRRRILHIPSARAQLHARQYRTQSPSKSSHSAHTCESVLRCTPLHRRSPCHGREDRSISNNPRKRSREQLVHSNGNPVDLLILKRQAAREIEPAPCNSLGVWVTLSAE